MNTVRNHRIYLTLCLMWTEHNYISNRTDAKTEAEKHLEICSLRLIYISPGNCAKQCKFRYVKSVRNFMWKLCYRKDNRAMHPIRECPENFRESLTTPTATIPKIFHGLLFRSILWMFLQNLKSVALPVPEIIGGTQKFGQPLDRGLRQRSLFSKIFNGLLFGLAL